ncbi:MAG: DUF1801 domain-containing protein [Candidatus Limnocylindrales bacterium]
MDAMPTEELLERASPPMREVAEWLRAIVRRTLPQAQERVRPGWGILGYDLPIDRRRTAFVAWIWAQPEHVHLGFPQGFLMRDPAGILDGAGVTKRARWTTHLPSDRLPEVTVIDLVVEAARIATMSRDERVAIQVVKSEAMGDTGEP